MMNLAHLEQQDGIDMMNLTHLEQLRHNDPGILKSNRIYMMNLTHLEQQKGRHDDAGTSWTATK